VYVCIINNANGVTQMTAQEKFAAKIQSQSVSSLKEMAKKLFADTREGADMVFSAVLDALMNRIPEDEFIAFCEEMEA
jgi:hypothetical protein